MSKSENICISKKGKNLISKQLLLQIILERVVNNRIIDVTAAATWPWRVGLRPVGCGQLSHSRDDAIHKQKTFLSKSLAHMVTTELRTPTSCGT